MFNKKDISKEHLYEGVKALVECSAAHKHLPQQKLYTLFSIGFQYLLYRSTKEPGAYIIRIEDSSLADKLVRRSKDSSTRKFLQSILLPRKLKYSGSTFYLDFFHIGSWALTNDIPKEKIKAALIVKNTSSRPMMDLMVDEENPVDDILASLPPDYFLTSLQEFVPETITVAFETEFDGVEKIKFPFIKTESERYIKGVKINTNIDLDSDI